MKLQKNIILALLFICFGSLQAQQIKINGFTQATMTKFERNKAFVFGFDRVRLCARGELNPLVDYKLLVDFVKHTTSPDKDGDTPGMLKDAVIIFKFYKNIKLSAGKFKTPLGMEFNTSGMKLDFVKRGLVQKLVFERNAGIMVHGKKIGKPGWGFALGIFNYGPNNANNVGSPTNRKDYTVASRLSISPKKSFYAEIFVGTAITSIDSQQNVYAGGAGFKLKPTRRLQLKGELITRSDKQNPVANGYDFYGQSGFLIKPWMETVIKYEQLNVQNSALDRTDITMGVNFFFNPANKHQSKIQLNYVFSDMKGKDAVQVMFQGAF